jgi:hypothetical protein
VDGATASTNFKANTPAKCNGATALLFVQVACILSPEQLNTRRVQGLFIGCLGVFISLFFVVFTDYMRSIFKNQYVEWDVKTITAGDYTAEMEITPTMWKQFVDVEYPRSQHGGKT